MLLMGDNLNLEQQRQAAAGQALEHVLCHRPPTISVPTAAIIAAIGRDRAYSEARLFLSTAGESGIPSVRDGRYLRVLTLPFLARYGIDLEVGRADENS
jgi:hypothetical protein